MHDFSSAAIPVHPASWLVVRSKRISTAPIRSSGFECSFDRTTDVVAMIENSLRVEYRVDEALAARQRDDVAVAGHLEEAVPAVGARRRLGEVLAVLALEEELAALVRGPDARAGTAGSARPPTDPSSHHTAHFHWSACWPMPPLQMTTGEAACLTAAVKAGGPAGRLLTRRPCRRSRCWWRSSPPPRRARRSSLLGAARRLRARACCSCAAAPTRRRSSSVRLRLPPSVQPTPRAHRDARAIRPRAQRRRRRV